jgi:hypothetical protein
MSATGEKTPKRFVHVTGDSLDACIGELFRNVRRPDPLGIDELERVGARLRAGGVSRIHPLRYAVLLATGMLAGTSFAVAAYGVQRLIEAPRPAPAAPPAPAPVVPAPLERPRATERAPEATGSEESPDVPKPARAAPSSAGNSALGRESELLARALASLRRDRDAGAALVLLDEHAREFPAGALRQEADVARLDALLALGRSEEALAHLERLPIDRLGRGAELRVLRGELRAQRDARRAIADFDRALSMSLGPELEERALFGRAASRLRVGDEEGGRADLTTYLAKHPNGRFAAEARRRLF